MALLWLVGVIAAGLVAGLTLHFLVPGWGRLAAPPESEAECDATQAVHRTGETPGDDESSPSDAEEASERPGASPEAAAVEVPERTSSVERGAVTVVDLGLDEASLLEALRAQQRIGTGRSQTLMVMLTGRRCRPCRGVDGALEDPQMQRALAGVRLIRVDIEAFREDIDTLGMPRDVYPAFFMLARDLSPRDTIHGGEWGDDVAGNIAPVLGAFVRGRYDERRYERAPTLRSLKL
ncbi:MAG: hypothetical protein JRI55_37535, partial [Deltaproteobacteria bacterium]|nr:hypothetical protein [Deltaproteobacteria bacterium]